MPFVWDRENGTTSYRRVKFSIDDEDRSERPVSVPTPVNIDAIHAKRFY